MEAQRLFEHLEIDWERLSGPPMPTAGPTAAGEGTTLARFRDEHLRSIPALRELYAEAVARGFIPESEASLIAFFATAAYCRRVGEKPAALLAYCLRNRIFPATLADEDRAYAALKAHLARLHPPGAWLRVRVSPAPAPPGSEHASGGA